MMRIENVEYSGIRPGEPGLTSGWVPGEVNRLHTWYSLPRKVNRLSLRLE